jgi:hypothetical protein
MLRVCRFSVFAGTARNRTIYKRFGWTLEFRLQTYAILGLVIAYSPMVVYSLVSTVLVVRIRSLWMVIVKPLVRAAPRIRLTKQRQAKCQKQDANSRYIRRFHSSSHLPQAFLGAGSGSMNNSHPHIALVFVEGQLRQHSAFPPPQTICGAA